MNNIYNDYQYFNYVNDIMENDKFMKLKECVHHGTSRFDHSLRVSYYSYLVTKALGLRYVETARGGLLHDFFVNEDLSYRKQKFSMFFHPYPALDNSKKYFKVNDLEEDIIINHMFPTLPHKIPKNIESWIVSIVDKLVAVYEFYESYGKVLFYKLPNLYIVLLFIFNWY